MSFELELGDATRCEPSWPRFFDDIIEKLCSFQTVGRHVLMWSDQSHHFDRHLFAGMCIEIATAIRAWPLASSI